MTALLSHLLVAVCDMGVRISVRSFVSPSVRLSTIYVESSIKVHFSVAEIAENIKPCIVIVLSILFKNALLLGALDLDFVHE